LEDGVSDKKIIGLVVVLGAIVLLVGAVAVRKLASPSPVADPLVPIAQNSPVPSQRSTTPTTAAAASTAPTPQRIVPSPPTPTKPPAYGTVSGAAWTVKNDGTSNLMRGLPLAVIPRSSADVASLISYLNNQEKGWKESVASYEKMATDEANRPAEYRSDQALEIFKKDLSDGKAMVAAIERTIRDLRQKAGLDRREAFMLEKQFQYYSTSLPTVGLSGKEVASGKTNVDGKYSITSVPVGDYYLVSSFGTASFVMDWIEPIHVSENQVTSVDLYNDNAVYVRNIGN
jgi:hypothetical protein